MIVYMLQCMPISIANVTQVKPSPERPNNRNTTATHQPRSRLTCMLLSPAQPLDSRAKASLQNWGRGCLRCTRLTRLNEAATRKLIGSNKGHGGLGVGRNALLNAAPPRSLTGSDWFCTVQQRPSRSLNCPSTPSRCCTSQSNP